MNPFYMEVMIKERQREELEYAARRRLLSACRVAAATRKARFFSALGRIMVLAGQKLIERYGTGVDMTSALARQKALRP